MNVTPEGTSAAGGGLMNATMVKVRFSFLASGPRFHMAIPDFFDQLPELSSPLERGGGGRAFLFRPSHRDEGVQDSEFLRTLQDRDGRIVELYERREPPPLWRLRWPLASGALYTHLREEDGVEMADVTVKALSVVEAPDGGTPVILPSPPLVFAASTRPGYQEEVTYFSAARGDGWGVTLQRPGFMPPGSTAIAPVENTGGLVALRVGLQFGIEGWIWAGMERETGDLIVRTLAESLTDSPTSEAIG